MISVIIPTYNRKEKLQKTLEAFQEQTLDKKEFEVIVVDDGGSDDTGDFMREFGQNPVMNLQYFSIEHAGPERARNLGIEKAQGDIILFCGDDTRPDKNLLQIHYAHYQQNENTALLGMALWDESESVSDFMRYLAPAGPQFHYNTIRNRDSAGFDHFYTCNISLAKKWLESEKFDERFNYAFEDIDLGLRLEKKGLKIIFDSKAKVYHAHFYDEESFGQRMERLGRSAVILFDKYKNDKKTGYALKIKYAPFLFFPGLKIFYQISKILSRLKLIKKINPKWHWFWRICCDYASGMVKELKR